MAKRGTVGSSQTEGQDEFEKFIDEARALGKVGVFRLDPVISEQNVADGVAALSGIDAARIKRELPAFDAKLLVRAPALARAVGFAARRADQHSNPALTPLIAEATKLRAKLLSAAVAFAEQGLVSTTKVEAIKRGRGALDVAQDCVDLAALFKSNAAALRGKSPVAAADVTRAGALGAQLVGTLRPKGSPRPKRSKEEVAVSADRDQLGALLVAAYDSIRRAGGWFFGPDADDVPPLGSRSVTRKAKTKAAASVAQTAPG